MTRDEAIRILDPETSRAALLPYAYDQPRRLAMVTEAMRMGAEALRGGADGAPVVDGKWIYNPDATDWGIGGYVCSKCGVKNNNLPCNKTRSVAFYSGARYCPHCGAKMDKSGES